MIITCEYLHDALLPHQVVGGPRRQRLRQGCQKLSATVSLRGEGGVNSTTGTVGSRAAKPPQPPPRRRVMRWRKFSPASGSAQALGAVNTGGNRARCCQEKAAYTMMSLGYRRAAGGEPIFSVEVYRLGFLKANAI
jgi:hypothetical protein